LPTQTPLSTRHDEYYRGSGFGFSYTIRLPSLPFPWAACARPWAYKIFQREETTSRRPQSKFEMPQNGELLEGQQRMSKKTRRMVPSSLNTNANLNDQWLTPKRKQNHCITSRKTNNTKLIQPFRVLVRIRL